MYFFRSDLLCRCYNALCKQTEYPNHVIKPKKKKKQNNVYTKNRRYTCMNILWKIKFNKFYFNLQSWNKKKCHLYTG